MPQDRRFIVYGSQGGVDDATPPAGSGTGQPGDQNSGTGGTGTASLSRTGQPGGQNPGQASGAGSPDGGASNRGTDPDSLWDRAASHYQPKIKKLEDENAELRKRYATNEAKAKTAEQLATELEAARRSEDRRAAMVAEFAESRTKALPEHLRGIIEKSANGDPYKKIELLPSFEDLAFRTQLKTIGGNSGGGNAPQIDYAGIRAAQERGDTRPLQEAHAKHGAKVYNDGLQKWLAERGR